MKNLIQKSFTPGLVTLIAMHALGASAMAQTTSMSSFYQDWKLDAAGSDASCAQTLSAYSGTDVPGTQGMPHASLDSSDSIRFVPGDTVSTEVFTAGTNPSALDDDGTVTVSISQNKLSILEQERGGVFFWRKKTTLNQSYNLLPNGGLVIETGSGNNSVNCNYTNAFPEKLGMVEVGAVLLNNGAKIAECKFVAATPAADQTNYVYNEKCSFGKYTVKQIINDSHVMISSELVSNEKAQHELEIVRSSGQLNTESENYLSRDTEIAVTDSKVDDVFVSSSEYYISPYRTNTYAIDGTHATVQIEYAPATQN
jgi:hypothetical protein